MSNTKTVHVPHLGGIEAAYQMPHAYDAKKPTLVLVNSFTTSSELYRSQYANKALNDAMNLIAFELLGHGQTRTQAENFTYWDTAIMNVQVLEALGMTGAGKKVFVLGTSQGGWITVRMALVAPDKVGSSSTLPLYFRSALPVRFGDPSLARVFCDRTDMRRLPQHSQVESLLGRR